MSRQKNTQQDDAIAEAAKQREAEMKPTPVVTQSFDAMQNDPVKTQGTTEAGEYSSDVDRVNRERYEAMERQKEEDIKKLKKDSDNKPKI